MSERREILVYERILRHPSGQESDRSAVISQFRVGGDFNQVSRGAVVQAYEITRIDAQGIWGVERAPQEQGA